jgi:CMP/dCMP kinase
MSLPLVIAVDGPSGAGKSTAARSLAARLGYTFIDSGAMYRAVALRALDQGLAVESAEAMGALAQATQVELVGSRPQVLADGSDVTDKIRTRAVSQAASRISAHSAVRRVLVARQRQLGERGAIVMDGRDIGSAVFPRADLKFYIDATPRCRALRRQLELGTAGTEIDLATIEREIVDRDRADSSRADSPLTRVPDAVWIDTSDLSPDEVLARMLVEVDRIERERPRR